MKRIFAVLALGASLDILGGCASQCFTERHYYEPTEKTAFRREDGTTVGAVKTEVIRSGSPDWSGSKSFNVIGIGK